MVTLQDAIETASEESLFLGLYDLGRRLGETRMAMQRRGRF